MNHKSGKDTPVVYGSPLLQPALRYPLAMRDDKNERCGEAVADDVEPGQTADFTNRRWSATDRTNVPRA